MNGRSTLGIIGSGLVAVVTFSADLLSLVDFSEEVLEDVAPEEPITQTTHPSSVSNLQHPSNSVEQSNLSLSVQQAEQGLATPIPEDDAEVDFDLSEADEEYVIKRIERLLSKQTHNKQVEQLNRLKEHLETMNVMDEECTADWDANKECYFNGRLITEMEYIFDKKKLLKEIDALE